MEVPELLKDKYILWLFVLSLAILTVAFFISYVNLWGVGNLLIIHSDIFEGADFFGTYYDVFGILGIAAIVWLLNALLANELYFRERLLSYLFAFFTFIFMVLILMAVNVIISLN